MNGPLHWSSKRQNITARSTAEAQVYATDECAKSVAHLRKLIFGLGLGKELMPNKTIIYNDNSAFVCWSHNMTTKGLRHIQIRENGVREMVQAGILGIEHIKGKLNLTNLFTKEDRDVEHFLSIRDVLLQPKSTFMQNRSPVNSNYGLGCKDI